MKKVNIDKGWKFRHGSPELEVISEKEYQMTDLPHDYMIASRVREDAPARSAQGFFTEGTAHYVKVFSVPEDWKEDKIYLGFDGVMMNATVFVNRDRVALHHNGYFPFYADITRQVYPGQENEIIVEVNPSMQPNSRWYSGAGIIRSVSLFHGASLHIAKDGIYGYTKRIAYDSAGNAVCAFLEVQVEVENHGMENRMTEVQIELKGLEEDRLYGTARQMIQVDSGKTGTAYLKMSIDEPELWSVENPALYRLYAKCVEKGVFKTRLIEKEDGVQDDSEILFGIRTVTADAKFGLRINGVSTKLKGGCIHHDNGLLGAVSVYDVEYRKVKKLKESGFNAIRTAHNPPSEDFLEVCDRLGMYVFDEAFDTWGMGKQPGDYHMFFDKDWREDLEAFVKRDRSRPSVIMWSTGNEITERGGLNNGYTLAGELVRAVKELDATRPVSNAICGLWSGLDIQLTLESQKKLQETMEGDSFGIQNADPDRDDLEWEKRTEAFANGLDIVGYNYLEEKYEQSHEMYPDRVILGSENFPKEIGKRWPMVEKLPYVIGDFTWTAWDYIGEAGIGKSVFLDEGDPRLKTGPFALMSYTSEFPWRLANDADFDINGNLLPQGEYRRIIWGKERLKVYSYDPGNFGKKELISPWGFTDVRKCWNWEGYEGKPVEVCVFSDAEEVELFLNGKSVGRKKQGESPAAERLEKSFLFQIEYEPGVLEAVGSSGGEEWARDHLVTTGKPAAIRLVWENTDDRTKESSKRQRNHLAYIGIEITDEKGQLVPDAGLPLSVTAESGLLIRGFGSAAPITDEDYTSMECRSFRGRALLIVEIREGGRVMVSAGDFRKDVRIVPFL